MESKTAYKSSFWNLYMTLQDLKGPCEALGICDFLQEQVRGIVDLLREGLWNLRPFTESVTSYRRSLWNLRPLIGAAFGIYDHLQEHFVEPMTSKGAICGIYNLLQDHGIIRPLTGAVCGI